MYPSVKKMVTVFFLKTFRIWNFFVHGHNNIFSLNNITYIIIQRTCLMNLLYVFSYGLVNFIKTFSFMYLDHFYNIIKALLSI